ncbi:MAG: RNA polymerase sigma factor [Kiritimatiellia bacterium]
MKKTDEKLDPELVTECLNGNQDTFAVLVERHQHSVYNLAYRMCGNASVAEDMAQETFIRAYRRLHQYQANYAFKNWLLGICANMSRSRYRRWRRNRELAQAYVRNELISREQHPRADAQTATAQAGLEEALAALPEKLRVPVILRYMESMTLEEVAATLNIKLSAVKMRLARAKDKLLSVMQSKACLERGAP